MGIAFILPSVILIAIFVYGFIGYTGYLSLSNYNTIVPDFSFAGLKNYKFLFNDFRFQADIRNTIFFTLFFILFVTGLGLFLAILIDSKIKAESFFRNVFLFPMSLSFIVTGVIWQWLLNPSTGFNYFLKCFGIQPKWYTDTNILRSEEHTSELQARGHLVCRLLLVT